MARRQKRRLKVDLIRDNGASATKNQGDEHATRTAVEHARFLGQCRAGNMHVLDDAVLRRHDESPKTPPISTTTAAQDICDSDGNNALMLAASSGHLKLVQALHARGNFDLDRVNRHGDNALHLAAFQGHMAVVEWLEQHGVGIYCMDSDDDSDDDDLHPDSSLIFGFEGWNSQDAVRAMYLALVRRGDVACLETFAANVGHASFPWHATDEYLYNALHVATEANQLAMLRFLLASSSSTKLSLAATTNRRDTCLHLAATEGHLLLVQFLVPRLPPAAVLAQNAQKWDALDTACFYGHIDLAQWLVANTSLAPTTKSFALAVEGQRLDILEWLVTLPHAGRHLHEHAGGDSLLHTAATLRHVAICRVLLAHGADILAVDAEGCNVLHVVIGTQWLEGLELLVDCCPDDALALVDVTFAARHASPKLFAWLYSHLPSHAIQQAAFQAAKTHGRADLMAVCHNIHDRLAADMMRASLEDGTKSTPRSNPSLMTKEDEAPVIPAMPVDARGNATSTPINAVLSVDLDSPLSSIDDVFHGTHADWGVVLVRRTRKADGYVMRQLSQQLVRLDWSTSSAAVDGRALLRYVDCEEDETYLYLVHEHCRCTWTALLATERQSSSSQSLAMARDAVAAVAFLHHHGRVHGALTPESFFIDAAHRTKLLLGSTVRWGHAAAAAFADDIYDLGQCLAFALDNSTHGQLPPDAIDLLDRMTDVDPAARPALDVVALHPYFWTTDTKLAYIEATANDMTLDFQAVRLPYAAGWQAKLPPGLDVHRYRHYDTSSTLDLVRWVRNLKQHAGEQPPSVWQALGTSHHMPTTMAQKVLLVGDVVTACFPELVLLLWRHFGALE
ncbi:Aste57867_13078 [Aphanomyces stellatus]|uniref:Aste57867_13078 protein n=1 Tax=Aphanomyces stellatus TaxID=120398 RepID=A0A485KX94_9STRA|nr:hypothetical protein As57867_013030 [Aphanomyces stellatus]VFT89922.1 Aste57867_13078 [Aphanomyces stellatus]